jgi:hypothetical protein
MDWNSSPTKNRSSVARRSISSHWSRFVSWKLVDEHGAEAPALALADLRLVAQQVARRQLEVLEIERRLASFAAA